MKTKRILAGILSMSLIFSSTMVSVSAADEKTSVSFGWAYVDGSDDVVTVPEKISGKVVDDILLWHDWEEDPVIKKLVISSTVKTMDIGHLDSLEEYEVDENNRYFTSVDGVIYDKEMKKLVYYPPAKPVKDFKIPEKVEIIGESAFLFAEKLECISIPENVKKIEKGAFAGSKIKKIDLNEGITDIEDFAFGGCTELERIVLPESLERIGEAFGDCTNLKEIIILHKDFEDNGPSSMIDPEKDNYFRLLRECEGVSVYVPDEEYEKYSNNAIGNIEANSIYKLSELSDSLYSGSNIETNDKVDTNEEEYNNIITLGDVNSDGKVDITDLSELSLAIIGDKTLTESQIKAADINENGKAELTDLARLRQYLSKVITSLKSSDIKDDKEKISKENAEIKWLGYSYNTGIHDNALNGKTGSVVIKSMSELSDYLSKAEKYAAVVSALEKYDEKFFEENILVLKLIEQSSGQGAGFSIENIKYADDKTLQIEYAKVNDSLTGPTASVSYNIATVSIPADNFHADTIEWTLLKNDAENSDISDSKEVLTMDKVFELAEKGNDLTPDALEKYDGEKNRDITIYPIEDSSYELIAGYSRETNQFGISLMNAVSAYANTVSLMTNSREQIEAYMNSQRIHPEIQDISNVDITEITMSGTKKYSLNNSGIDSLKPVIQDILAGRDEDSNWKACSQAFVNYHITYGDGRTSDILIIDKYVVVDEKGYVTTSEECNRLSSFAKKAEEMNYCIPVSTPEQPVAFKDTTEMINVLNADKSGVYDTIKKDNRIIQLENSDVLLLRDDLPVYIYPYAKYEDFGICYYIKYNENTYQLMVYYISPEIFAKGISDYLKQRFNENILKEISVNGQETAVTEFGITDDTRRICASAFIDDSHYYTVKSYVGGTEEELTDFLNNMTFVNVQIA